MLTFEIVLQSNIKKSLTISLTVMMLLSCIYCLQCKKPLMFKISSHVVLGILSRSLIVTCFVDFEVIPLPFSIVYSEKKNIKNCLTLTHMPHHSEGVGNRLNRNRIRRAHRTFPSDCKSNLIQLWHQLCTVLMGLRRSWCSSCFVVGSETDGFTYAGWMFPIRKR